MALFNPDTGMIVRDGDGDALIQHTKNRTPMWNTNLFRMVTSIVLSQKN